MRDYFAEIMFVISYSGRAHAAIFMGIVSFLIIQWIGNIVLSDFQLSGHLSILTDVIKEKLGHRYDNLAWITLLGFWITAIKRYHKDKKKLV